MSSFADVGGAAWEVIFLEMEARGSEEGSVLTWTKTEEEGG